MAQKTNYVGYSISVGSVIGFLNIDETVDFDDIKVIFTLEGTEYEAEIQKLQSKEKSSPLLRKKKSSTSI